ncbi:MAG: PAS domain-containing protein, partial [Candidatus Cloacimonadota bacterium]|nr:PAS domain-containing protein [Candidatus Cloacimonadota bacterium]
MSEFINNSEKRVDAILQFSLGMLNKKNGSLLFEKYKDELESMTPHDVIEMQDRQINLDVSIADIKIHLEKVLNVVSSALEKYQWEKPTEGHPIFYLMQENRELEKVLSKIKAAIINDDFSQMVELFKNLQNYENHMIRKENILFPYIEKLWDNYGCLKIMWSLHDDIRKNLKTIVQLFKTQKKITPEINKLIGEIFFLMYGMIFKEELIVYPVAIETFSDTDWQKIQEQSLEIGYSYIETPQNITPLKKENPKSSISDLFWKVETGELSKKQLELLLNHLPFDVTFVDENDEVRFFSRPKDRFFPRSPAIIGRKVQDCHPPESVHIVKKIVEEFKAGNKTEA